MGTTLYLLRQQPDRISPSLHRAGDADMDVVFIERAASSASSPIEGGVGSGKKMINVDFRSALTYADLVDKIFSSEHVIVL